MDAVAPIVGSIAFNSQLPAELGPLERPRVSSSSTILTVKGPFDLARSLEAQARFHGSSGPVAAKLTAAVVIAGIPTRIEITETNRAASLARPALKITSNRTVPRRPLLQMARRLVAADLDLRPFYRAASRQPVLAAAVRALRGLKPLPPPSLFEMAVIAISEQQLSMVAAFRIRSRLVERFGRAVGDSRIFPTPSRLAAATIRALRACGLSRRKAKYVRGLAARVAAGTLDIEGLQAKTDAAVAAALVREHGFGEWSAQYFLARGLGRTDCLPAADVGLRRVVGKYLGRGRRLSPAQLERVLSPFRPFRGLAAFYLAVYARLGKGSKGADMASAAFGSRLRSRANNQRFAARGQLPSRGARTGAHGS